MALTKFQALVSRESLAEVYISDPNRPDRDGDAATVITIRENTTFRRTWIFEVESHGETFWCLPEHLTPSRHLLALIENGTYNEETMTWNGRNTENWKSVTLPLSY